MSKSFIIISSVLTRATKVLCTKELGININKLRKITTNSNKVWSSFYRISQLSVYTAIQNCFAQVN